MCNAPRWINLLLVCATLLHATSGSATSAEQAAIDRAIEAGKAFLLQESKTRTDTRNGAHFSLASYALVKAGVDKHHPDIQKSVQEVLAKCSTSNYGPGTHHNYEAGVDAMLLEAVDRVAYRPQLEMIAKYLIGTQRPHGGWYYPNINGIGGLEFGDTSITQYAVLGLWAASRADVEIPVETWDRVAKWLITTQLRNGGYVYHPADPKTGNPGFDALATMNMAGTGSLLIVRHVLFREVAFVDEELRAAVASPTTNKRFGVLDRVADDKEKKAKPKVRGNTTMTVSSFDKAIKEGVKWGGDHFGDPTAMNDYANYYFYGIERVGALLDSEKLGSHHWYDEGADLLLPRQTPNGSWIDKCGGVPATSLTLLFLTKATSGIIQPPKRPAPLVGGGLLVGGRGLPDNLDAVKIKEGEVSKRKMHGPVDGLLAELEKSSGAKVEAAQEAVVEAVQLDNPEELIGQVDRLKRLATDKRVEVRRTAMWALGRTGDTSVAPLLIRGLADVDESVMREASVGLSILSRRPNGWGLPIDPANGLADDASNEERLAHFAKWQKETSKAWSEWYMKVRPYDERDDRTTLKRKP